MSYGLSGNAVLSTGAPADKVFIRDWTTGLHAGVVTPDGSGNWSLGGLTNGSTYEVVAHGSTGYQPIAHGPVSPVSNGLTEALWDPANKGTNCTLSGSNRIATFSGVGMVRSDLSKTSGTWYCELTVNAGSNNMVFGIVNASANLNQYVGQDANGWGYYGNGGVLNNGSASGTQASYTTGDVIGVKFSPAAGTAQFYKNGVATGSGLTGLPSTMYLATGAGGSGTTSTVNTGQSPFYGAVPAGANPGMY